MNHWRAEARERRLERRNRFSSTVQPTFMELLGPVHAGVAEGRSQAQGWRPQAGGRGTGAPKEPIPWRILWGCSQGLREDKERCEPHRTGRGPEKAS